MEEPQFSRCLSNSDGIPEGSPLEFDRPSSLSSCLYCRESSTSSGGSARVRMRVSFGPEQVRLYDANQPSKDIMNFSNCRSMPVAERSSGRPQAPSSHKSLFSRIIVPLRSRKRSPKGPA
eukprot:GGOE01055697.1.p2 GENE.GGOE01055697.1~~GGOE01055697.1.p2  ORF type:complete len:120 (-),score=4.22 GGOE01055697.1:489-848(-)